MLDASKGTGQSKAETIYPRNMPRSAAIETRRSLCRRFQPPTLRSFSNMVGVSLLTQPVAPDGVFSQNFVKTTFEAQQGG